MSDAAETGKEVWELRMRLAAAEKELRWSTRNFSQALEQGHAAVYRRNFDEATYEYMGDHIEALTGYPASDITPAIWDGLILKAETRGELAGLSLDECNRRVRSGAIERWQADVLIRTRSGGRRWVTDMSTVLRDDAGSCYGCLGILQDITERKHAEARLADTTRQLQLRNRHMEADLALARRTQQALLPRAMPRFPMDPVPGQGSFTFAHQFLPIEAVAGDLLAILPLSATRVGIFLCDVMGHGVRAALVTALVYALVQSLATDAADAGEVMTELNRRYLSCLSQEEEAVFTTAFYAVADTRDRSFQYASAGHPVPFHLRANGAGRGVEPLDAAHSGPALALTPGARYHTHRVSLVPGDRVFLYTDGVYEMTNADRETYGLAGLRQALDWHRDADSATLIGAVLDEVRRFGGEEAFEDDVCLLLIDTL